jgi:hypothetical protein
MLVVYAQIFGKNALYILHVLFNSFKRATRKLFASFMSRAEF